MFHANLQQDLFLALTLGHIRLIYKMARKWQVEMVDYLKPAVCA